MGFSIGCGDLLEESQGRKIIQVRHVLNRDDQSTQRFAERRKRSPEDVRRVAPALQRYTQERLYGEVWTRPGLSPRDRGIVTLAALIARNQTLAWPHYIGMALDRGVKPGEISEIIVHLAYSSGWSNAYAAVGAAKDVFAGRAIGPEELPAASGNSLPLDEAAEGYLVLD